MYAQSPMKTQITYIGHAMVLFEKDGKKLLTDPWLAPSINFEGLFPFPPLPTSTEALPSQIDYIHISHIHHDHFCRKTLSLFKRSTPIIIAEYEDKIFFQEIKKLGFNNIIEVKEGLGFQVGPFSLTSYISHPEDRSFDSSIVISTDDENFFLNNDCRLSDDVYRDIKQKFQVISGAFLGYSGVSPFPTCYHFLKPEVDRKSIIEESKKFYLDHFLRVTEFLQCEWICPYANGLRCLKPETLPSNETFSSFADVQALPVRSLVLFMEPGDSFETKGHRDFKKTPLLNYDLEGIQAYAKKIEFKKYPLVTRDDLAGIFIFLNHLANQNLAQLKLLRPLSPLAVNIELKDGQDLILARWSMTFDSNKLLLQQREMEDPDMIVTYPADLLNECRLGRGILAQIHYGFQYHVVVKNLKHDFFRILTGKSPGESLD